jgi:putative pyruvate formate lyase activating enzyme
MIGLSRRAPSETERCALCPRECGVDRERGELGLCGESARCRVASIGLHFGEEPPLSGTRGSGTFFFSGCSSGCLFCQNAQISLEHTGRVIDAEALQSEARALIARGAHNLNFVTPDHFYPHVEALCRLLRAAGETLPFVFNSSGYHRPDDIPRYAECMDIFLPDFKFADPDLARACMGDARYPDLALASIVRMASERGFLTPWDPTGERPAQEGLLVRHLVLPGQAQNSLDVLSALHRELGPRLPVSIMSQYHPMPRCRERGFLDRAVSSAEYEEVCRAAEELGFAHAFIQQGPADTAFLPDFEREEPFSGNRERSRE